MMLTSTHSEFLVGSSWWSFLSFFISFHNNSLLLLSNLVKRSLIIVILFGSGVYRDNHSKSGLFVICHTHTHGLLNDCTKGPQTFLPSASRLVSLLQFLLLIYDCLSFPLLSSPSWVDRVKTVWSPIFGSASQSFIGTHDQTSQRNERESRTIAGWTNLFSDRVIVQRLVRRSWRLWILFFLSLPPHTHTQVHDPDAQRKANQRKRMKRDPELHSRPNNWLD